MGRWSLILVVLGSLLGPAGALAEPGGVAATHFYTFVPGDDDLGGPPILLIEGTELQYVNADPAAHSFTSVARTPTGEWLFDSGVVLLGGVEPVEGTDELAPGDYPFMCSVHPALMRGMLRVLTRPV